jgi:hypothetical protein
MTDAVIIGGGINAMAAAARRRKSTFPSREAARANYAAKPPLGGLHPEALDAYGTTATRFALASAGEGVDDIQLHIADAAGVARHARSRALFRRHVHCDGPIVGRILPLGKGELCPP